jgi:hypothetical protein
VRVLLGALFFVFGLNGFLNFIPPPAGPMPQGAVAFGAALVATGYMFPLVKGIEVLCGALLLCNRFVPLALTLLAPVVVNILAFHVFLASDGVGMAALVVLLEGGLAWLYRDAFAPLLSRRTAPSIVAHSPELTLGRREGGL